ncbi:hypothetical protein AJ80_04667 [Polytolypa hystricis UAMH7299]|uniref:Coupling of ubiquitin conjugation to ER degradation protein 1 n=1 Tax=Polytolypa hystricis (strain UAMH7299) TaxID=1447883 RepID=A0A2B7Y199_POLH7|nr:hypothetical protein AJ80_04667 [Polytolypa hystricis UAMH7299]
MADAEPSLNIPSLLTLAVVSFFVIRWIFSSSRSGSGSDAGGAGSNTQRRAGRRVVDPAQVEQIAQMFPQLNRRDVMWDLQRNGGSVAATTERVLAGVGLETPPPSFQPQIPVPSTPATPANSGAQTPAAKPKADDLISRYNLASKINSEDAAAGAETQTAGNSSTIIHQESAWSQTRSERQRLLQKRRDDMILAARRKMQEKDRDGAGL